MFKTTRTKVAPGWEALLGRHQLDSVKGVFACEAGKIVSSSPSTNVVRVPLAGPAGEITVFIKRNWLSKLSQLRSRIFRGTLFGKSKVRREYDNLLLLREWGLPVPTAVATGETRRLGWLVASFLISEGIPNAESLDAFIQARLGTQSQPRQRDGRNELLTALARLIHRMHGHRFAHRDLFLRNIAIASGDPAQLWLIDMPRGFQWAMDSDWRIRANDLGSLDAAAPLFFRRTERLRFFLTYMGHEALTPEDKLLVRKILEAAAPMRRRQAYHIKSGQVRNEPAPEAKPPIPS